MKTTTVDLENRQRELLSEMDENGDIPNQSEGIREGVDLLAEKHGYKNGKNGNTALKFFVHRAGLLLSVAGLVGLAFTFAYPVTARVPSFAVLVAGACFYGCYNYLSEHEPDVSNKIRGLFGGETA